LPSDPRSERTHTILNLRTSFAVKQERHGEAGGLRFQPNDLVTFAR